MMINDYEEEMITEMMKIEQYLSHCCFIQEEGMELVDDDFLTALNWCVNFMYNFIDIENIDVGSEDENDLNFKLIMNKIEYYQRMEEICKEHKEE